MGKWFYTKSETNFLSQKISHGQLSKLQKIVTNVTYNKFGINLRVVVEVVIYYKNV